MLHICNIKRFPPCCCIGQMLNFTENATYFLYKSHRSCQKHSNFGRETYEIFRKPFAHVSRSVVNFVKCFHMSAGGLVISGLVLGKLVKVKLGFFSLITSMHVSIGKMNGLFRFRRHKSNSHAQKIHTCKYTLVCKSTCE